MGSRCLTDLSDRIGIGNSTWNTNKISYRLGFFWTHFVKSGCHVPSEQLNVIMNDGFPLQRANEASGVSIFLIIIRKPVNTQSLVVWDTTALVRCLCNKHAIVAIVSRSYAMYMKLQDSKAIDIDAVTFRTYRDCIGEDPYHVKCDIVLRYETVNLYTLRAKYKLIYHN